MKHNCKGKKNCKGRKILSGSGKSLLSPPKAMSDLVGITNTDKRQTPHQSAEFDHGKITGPFSKPVSLK